MNIYFIKRISGNIQICFIDINQVKYFMDKKVQFISLKKHFMKNKNIILLYSN